MEKALLRNDRADQEGNENDDRDRAHADAIEVMDDRGQTKASRRHQGAAEKHDERADHGRQSERLRAHDFDAATDVRKTRKRPCDPQGRRGGASIGPAHVFDETVELFGQPNQRHLPRSPVAAHQALQNPGAVRIEFLDVAHVDFKH